MYLNYFDINYKLLYLNHKKIIVLCLAASFLILYVTAVVCHLMVKMSIATSTNLISNFFFVRCPLIIRITWMSKDNTNIKDLFIHFNVAAYVAVSFASSRL